MLVTLEMSMTNVFTVGSTHFHKDNPFKPPKKSYIHSATLNLQKDDILLFLQKGPRHLEKRHVISLSVCKESIQDEGRL